MDTPPAQNEHTPATPATAEVHVSDVKVNLDAPLKHARAHRLRRWIFGVLMVIGMAMVGVGVYAYQFTKTNITDKTNQLGFFQQVHRMIDNTVEPLRGEHDDRINVLLLGNGGEGHQGGILTDTIIVASIKPSTKEVALISIPRDLVVPYYGEDPDYPEYRKINNAVYFGGIELAKEKATDVTGLHMHYYLEVDFEAFRDIINTLGGVDVQVDTAFTDYSYPDYNYGYQTISFTTGVQHMQGEQALQFARSRHGNNGEGSDFARAARQQKILEAVQANVLSASTLLNPLKMGGLLGDLGDHVATDMEIWEMLRFAEMAKEIEQGSTINSVIDNSEGGLLVDDRGIDNAYILIPRIGLGDYSEIHTLAAQVFDAPESTVTTTEETAAVVAEAAVVAVQNGSSVTGLATTSAHALGALGIAVDQRDIVNALTRQNTTTVVYDISGGANPATAAALADYFGATVVSATLPANTNSSVRVASDVDSSRVNITVLPADVDFIVLIGSDAPRASSTNPSQTNANTAL